MHAAFGTVLWIVCGIGIVLAAVALATSGKTWEEFGKRRLLLERDLRGPERRDAGADLQEREAEIRQMLEARNARRARRGEAPLDVEGELRRLTRTEPRIDSALRGEIRDLVIARNHRRMRQGKPPLDVEAEIAREIAALADLASQ